MDVLMYAIFAKYTIHIKKYKKKSTFFLEKTYLYAICIPYIEHAYQAGKDDIRDIILRIKYFVPICLFCIPDIV